MKQKIKFQTLYKFNAFKQNFVRIFEIVIRGEQIPDYRLSTSEWATTFNKSWNKAGVNFCAKQVKQEQFLFLSYQIPNNVLSN